MGTSPHHVPGTTLGFGQSRWGLWRCTPWHRVSAWPMPAIYYSFICCYATTVEKERQGTAWIYRQGWANLPPNLGCFSKVPRPAARRPFNITLKSGHRSPEEQGNHSLENFTIKGNCPVLSLRTLHTSLGSYKNNYQVISKGYWVFFFFLFLRSQSISPRMTLASFSLRDSCCSGKADSFAGGTGGSQHCLLNLLWASVSWTLCWS